MHVSDEQLQAMHDGEVAVDPHVATCDACRTRLDELAAMSSLVRGVADQAESLSMIARHRVRNRIDELFERGLIRFAWEASGVAAAVLLGGLWWMSHAPARNAPMQTATAQSTQAAPPWVEAAASVHRISDDAAATPAAQWYLADASSRNDEVP